jgi:hypothetical protein
MTSLKAVFDEWVSITHRHPVAAGVLAFGVVAGIIVSKLVSRIHKP